MGIVALETKKYEHLGPHTLSQQLKHQPVKSYFFNEYGLYNFSGNVSEVISDKNIAKGDSFNAGGFDIQIDQALSFHEPSLDVGFIPVFTIELTE